MKGRREGEEMGRARKIICSSFLQQEQQRTQQRKKDNNYFSNKNCNPIFIKIDFLKFLVALCICVCMCIYVYEKHGKERGNTYNSTIFYKYISKIFHHEKIFYHNKLRD